MPDINKATELEELKKQLADARQQINNLRISVRAEELRVKISSEYSNFGLWEYDIAEDICYQYKKLNGRYETNLEPIVHFRDTVISWGSVCAEDLPVFNKFCDALERGDKEIGCEVRVINDDCDIVWFRYEGRTVFDDSGKPVRVIGRTLDVTAEKGGVGGKSDSRRDKLTGTYTEEAFAEDVRNKTSGSNRFVSSALIVARIDNFDGIGESFGHEFEEYVVKNTARMLLGLCACEHDSSVSYMGNGAFAVFVIFNNKAALDSIAAKINGAVSNYPFGDNLRITVSVGISLLRNGKEFPAARSEANTAARFAGVKGGNCYAYYNSSMSVEPAAEDCFAEDGASSFLKGAAKIYSLVAKVFADRENRVPLMTEAMREAGRFVSADTVLVYIFSDGESVCYPTLVTIGGSAAQAPKAAPVCDIAALKENLAANGEMWLDSANVADNGTFGLANGAESAVVRAILSEDSQVIGYFMFGFAKRRTPTVSDLELLGMLSDSVNKLFAAYKQESAEAGKMRFSRAVINNLHVEGFSVIPGTYVVEKVGDNALSHYNVVPGDVCYKKVRGQSEPCRDCPIRQLERGMMSAVSTYYSEKDHRWIEVAASAEDNEKGETRYVIASTDITDCLGKVSASDVLTGLMSFDTFSAEAMRLTAQTHEGYYVAVLNIADFRRINETLGYEFGNSLLIAVADILETAVGAGELLCRSEGSRFVALIKNNSQGELNTRLSQLLASIQKQVYEKCTKQIYLLVGIYEMSEESVGIMGALDRAIRAQKTVKDKTYYRENLVAYYDSKLRDELRNRQYIEAHMLEALDNDEFKVYYQPKVSIATGKIVGAEALVRWIRGNGEIISPGNFVPIFESNGFIADMDFAIYRHSIADIKRWLRNGIDVPLISLNVSRHHLKDDSFASKLNALVDGVGVPHDRIELEITESLLTDNLNQLVEVMTQLKNNGFRISVDDFGSGYSSLNLITLLPFDTLKIDGGFFLRNDLTDKNKKVISSVVTLAKSLNLETVSEGVETQVQVDFLRDLGCDMIQGYFYYKPMPSADFEKLIAAQTAQKSLPVKELETVGV
jgi:diguanylate cyclase (GGDEF)-like protein